MKTMLWLVPVMLVVGIAAAACATRTFVRAEIRNVESRSSPR